MSSGKCRPFCLGLNVLRFVKAVHFQKKIMLKYLLDYFDVLTQDCSNSIANALVLLLSYSSPQIIS